MRPTLFLSDLHLSPARPALVAAFHAFCNGPAREAGGVYILGDLFDDWIGDDQLKEPLAAEVGRALKSLTEAGVAVGVVTGNRDFFLGDAFAHATGITLLAAPLVVNVAGIPTMLLHGDELCTADKSYQRMRRITHDERWQRRFLALPYSVRRGFANWLRRKSKSAISGKPEVIMDVEASAVESAFREAGVARMIHGHTHRPARHHLVVDSRECERFVLADWYDRGTYLEFDAAGGRTRDVAVAAP